MSVLLELSGSIEGAACGAGDAGANEETAGDGVSGETGDRLRLAALLSSLLLSVAQESDTGMREGTVKADTGARNPGSN